MDSEFTTGEGAVSAKFSCEFDDRINALRAPGKDERSDLEKLSSRLGRKMERNKPEGRVSRQAGIVSAQGGAQHIPSTGELRNHTSSPFRSNKAVDILKGKNADAANCNDEARTKRKRSRASRGRRRAGERYRRAVSRVWEGGREGWLQGGGVHTGWLTCRHG